MAEPSGQEILMLELVNRARLDPAGEAARYGIDLNEGLAPGTISTASKQPLAWSAALFAAADGHSQSMIDFDYFAHNDPNTGSTPQSRANAAGYSGLVGENIAERGVSPGPINPTTAIVQEHQDLFVDAGISGRGHRLNILSPNYQEIGVGQVVGDFQGFSASMVTQDFGIPNASGEFVTGVAYVDSDHNDFYSVGEGVAGLNVAIGAAGTSSQSAGNYSLATTATGTQSITLTGGGLAGPVTFVTALSTSHNIKLDVVDGHTLHTSASGTISGPISVVEGLGVSGLTLTTGAGSQTIIGTKGNDALDGGAGTDVLSGGIGDDSYFVDNAGDSIVENASEGNDIVNAAVDYTLPANVDSIILTGSANINAAGNGLPNALIGNSGDNALDGKAGDDFMVGGLGNDIYYIDSAGDRVTENPNEGNDIAYASFDYTLGANVDSVVLIEGAGNINAAGSNEVNALVGNSGNNALDGKGGDDYMVGGAGNDIYYVDAAGDRVVENPNEGNDIVYATFDYTLGANAESVVLVEGAGNINAAGNGDDNALIGNSGNNALDGKGGADYMVGGAGNDVYYVETPGDTVVENANEGANDIVHAMLNYTLGANVEALILDGTAALSGTGNGANNSIVGNSGANTLDGRGGQDFLSGNGGNDTFRFQNGEAGGDTIADFDGNGALLGDSLMFAGFGTAAQGATFTQIGATNQWQIHSGLDGHDEIITLQNGAAVIASDYLFV